jgi:alpha-amylase/alpha-mannosidase (GH57 family)
MDSMSNTITEGVQKAVDGIRQYLAHLKFITSDISIRCETIKVSIQQDSTSCGICMLSNVELFINSFYEDSEDIKLTIENENYTICEYRQKLIKNIFDNCS